MRERRSWSLEQIDREQRQRDEQQAQHQEHEEQDPGHVGSDGSDAGESQHARDDRDDGEDQSPLQHRNTFIRDGNEGPGYGPARLIAASAFSRANSALACFRHSSFCGPARSSHFSLATSYSASALAMRTL